MQSELNKAAEKAAAKRISELLTSPQHLTNVDQLKETTIKKKIALEAQIKSVVQTQLEDAKESYNLLNESNSLIGNVRTDMKRIDSLCGDSQTLISNKVFGVIRKVDRTRENLLNTLKEISRLLRIPEMIGKIENLLQDDVNILQVYIETRALIKMRDGAYQQASGNSEEQRVLQIAYKQIDELVKVFEERLFKLAGLANKLAERDPCVLVKVIQVVEKSEANDALLRKIMLEGGQDPDDERNYSKFNRYKEKFFQALRDSITRRFDKVLKGAETPSVMMDNVQTLVDDLTTVLDDLLPCFPDSYNIFEFYVKEYHIRINTLLLVFSTSPDNVSAQEIVDLIIWIKNYNAQIARLGVEDPQPPLMESIEPLFGSYNVHIKKLMESWVTTGMQQDRDEKPVLFEGVYISLAPSIIFEGIRAQIDIAKSAGDTKFLYMVLTECAATLRTFQQTCIDMLGHEWNDLPLEYIMAQINNSSKCCDQVEELEGKIPELLADPTDESYIQKAEQIFAPMMEGFQSVAYKGIATLVNIIFRDISEATEKIFQKEWIEGRVMESIIATIEDYFADLEGYIMESYFKKLAVETLDRLINLCLLQLFTKKHPPLNDTTVERLLDDEALIKDCFIKHVRKKLVVQKLQVFVDLRDIIDAYGKLIVVVDILREPDTISLAFYGLLRNNPDVSIDIVLAILSMRGNLEKSQRSQAEEGCRKMLEQLQKEKEREREKHPEDALVEPEPSVFTKLDLNAQVKAIYSKGFFR